MAQLATIPTAAMAELAFHAFGDAHQPPAGVQTYHDIPINTIHH